MQIFEEVAQAREICTKTVCTVLWFVTIVIPVVFWVTGLVTVTMVTMFGPVTVPVVFWPCDWLAYPSLVLDVLRGCLHAE